jgi:hypothetical protein
MAQHLDRPEAFRVFLTKTAKGQFVSKPGSGSIRHIGPKTSVKLRTLDDEDYRRRMGREPKKGEASHDLSRFLCFGKEGALRGREFADQIHTFSCLSVLDNAVVAWNTLHIGPIVGQMIDDDILGLRTPLFRKHVNPFGSTTSILNACARLRVAQSKVSLNGGFRADVPNTR